MSVTNSRLSLQEIQQLAADGPLSASVLGQLADLYDAYRDERLEADKVAAGLKATESAAQELLITQMRLQEVSAVGGKSVRLGLSGPDYVPSVTDWPKFYEFIKENDAFELLERRPGKAACRERWEDGQVVPGVEKFPVYKLSRSEVKK